MGMMGKLKETQQKVEETKKRLDTVYVEESSADGSLRVQVTANKSITEIHIAPSRESEADLSTALTALLNAALEKAGKIQEAELSAVAKEGMPNIPGLDKMFR